ncbi:MAG: glycosyltransferase family 4 protein [Thermofilaceae archaeon]
MKILILTHEYPPYVFGGVAYYNFELARFLASRGHKVYVVCGRGVDITKDNGVVIYRTNFPDILIRSIWYSLSSIDIIMNLINKVDIVISNAGSIYAIHKIIKKNRKKLISIFHGTIESLLSFFKYIKISHLKFISVGDIGYYLMAPLYDRIYRNEIKYADNYIMVAHHVFSEILQLYKEFENKILSNSYVIYTGINIDQLTSYFREQRRRNKYILAYVGRLYYTKGVYYAIKAFELIQNNYINDAELWIFGNGPLFNYIKNYSKKYKLRIKLFGFIPRDQMYNYLYKYVNVLLFPSLYEGSPYALIEANALGIPAVTWDLPWAHEFVINGVNGYRAKFNSIEDIAQKAIKAHSLNSNTIREITKKYDKKVQFNKLLNIIENK